MLAISMAPPMPHLLSRLDPAHPLSMFPTEDVGPHHLPSPGKRPKLSLRTSDLAPSFHSSTSRQNGITTGATATPTTLNTFNNTFDLAYRPSPVTTLPSPGPHSQAKGSAHPTSPIGKFSEHPYILNLPFGVHSILKNSPLPRDIRRPSVSASPRVAGRRVFFPAPKKVAFRPELEEEVVTKNYIMRHADLSSSDEESLPSESEEQSGTSTDEDRDDSDNVRKIRVDEVSPHKKRKRRSIAVSPSSSSGLEQARIERPQSGSTTRSKRKRRRWEWTLDSSISNPAKAEGVSEEVREDPRPPMEEPGSSPDADRRGPG
ncbi:uncharacterized protein Z520_07330 [Fonsecaea multimorphosa CBS 102226]|uniref:Uncharacterized protein n=1 Tax=Fonsecaea multimorphosa CBS 102226 TaxID=1442371 RepID=A0A0D2H5T4_9EURO|nr:uncharacterized protein Z520_07330 [Fonsecaea multimorphosa CBS 102226]KIX97215.1 hypothetical protein Z520_07330 [Fonsecaea multimorphosa CBS 102226]OAL22988.1 hypothetical protein AYO22_06896 [Fonsecaea multimorphosa]